MKKLILLVASGVYWFSLYLYIPFLTPYLLSLGVSATVAGMIFGLHSFSQMLLRFPVGIYSDSMGKQKPFIVAGMAFTAVAALLMYFFPTPALLGVGNFVSGFSSAMYVGFTVLYGKYYEKTETNKAMGVIGAITDVGIFAAFLVGGALYQADGIKILFLGSAVAGAVGIVLSLFVVEVPQQAVPTPTKQEMLATIKNKELLMSSLLCILVKGIVFATAFSFTPKISQDLGATGIERGIINALFIGTSVVGSFFVASKPGQKLGNTRTTLLGFVILGGYALSVPFVRSIGALMVVQLIGGLGYASLTAIFMANAVRHLPPEQKATGMGLYQALYSVGSTLGPVLLGAFADAFSYTVGFIAIAVVAAVGFVLTLVADRKNLMN
jgi:MFS family permease